jgi:hypothetical protein
MAASKRTNLTQLGELSHNASAFCTVCRHQLRRNSSFVGCVPALAWGELPISRVTGKVPYQDFTFPISALIVQVDYFLRLKYEV